MPFSHPNILATHQSLEFLEAKQRRTVRKEAMEELQPQTPELPYELWDLIFSFVTDFYEYYRVLPRVCR